MKLFTGCCLPQKSEEEIQTKGGDVDCKGEENQNFHMNQDLLFINVQTHIITNWSGNGCDWLVLVAECIAEWSTWGWWYWSGRSWCCCDGTVWAESEFDAETVSTCVTENSEEEEEERRWGSDPVRIDPVSDDTGQEVQPGTGTGSYYGSITGSMRGRNTVTESGLFQVLFTFSVFVY